jgi:hypothetical protein
MTNFWIYFSILLYAAKTCWVSTVQDKPDNKMVKRYSVSHALVTISQLVYYLNLLKFKTVYNCYHFPCPDDEAPKLKFKTWSQTHFEFQGPINIMLYK